MRKIKITNITVQRYNLKLKEPFKIALGTITEAKNVLVIIETDTGLKGYGEAVEMPFVTGEVQSGIISAIENHISPILIGEDPRNIERIITKMDVALQGNMAAKAGVDIALHDLVGKIAKMPLYQWLGGYENHYESDITIGISETGIMVEKALKAMRMGYSALKIKVGIDSRKDVERVKKIREAVGPKIIIRLDANQGWQPKEAIHVINQLSSFDIELVEQPVPASDIEGLGFVRRNVGVPIMADESVFSPEDALRVIQEKAVDMINIKLMKSGGIFKAKKISDLAEAAGIPCMVGCMLESKIAVTAAAHLVASSKNIQIVDLDSPTFLADDFVDGGVEAVGGKIVLPASEGLGIKNISI